MDPCPPFSRWKTRVIAARRVATATLTLRPTRLVTKAPLPRCRPPRRFARETVAAAEHAVRSRTWRTTLASLSTRELKAPVRGTRR